MSRTMMMMAKSELRSGKLAQPSGLAVQSCLMFRVSAQCHMRWQHGAAFCMQHLHLHLLTPPEH